VKKELNMIHYLQNYILCFASQIKSTKIQVNV